ncbi:lim and transglutaminase domain protein ltd-1-like [Saccostrea cucullata]|uniref:lim and transglutaminase domain protein ltd-1-like n=1 Tax=Saccostrea cuccullata TaxID=36930 RepID=UPI002ED665F6
MGSNSSTQASSTSNVKKPGVQREPDEEDVDVPEFPPDEDYPPPKQNSLKKDDIYEHWKYKDVHQHVRKIPGKIDLSFQQLLDYLVVPFRTDMQKVRALFMWLCVQPITTTKYKNLEGYPPEDLARTPRGFMKLIKEGRASYASLFAVLCRKSGIKCAIIKGVCKSAGYEVGTTDTLKDLRSKWNVVWVKDSWRLIHPLWACQTVIGKSGLDKWTAYDDEEENTEGWTIQKINEFFFLTDPHDFLYFCFPDDPKWQLLTVPYDLNRFVRVPFLQEAYFGLGLKLITEQSCILHDIDGVVEIAFRVPDDYPTQMNYDLLFKRDESEVDLDNKTPLNKYVLMNYEDNIWTFIVRFPVPGVYKLSIFGGHVDRENVPWIADFRLVCENPRENCVPFPDAPWIGLGYSYEAQKGGLIDPSQKSGLLVMKPHQDIHITIMVETGINIKVKFLHILLSENELKERFYCKKNVGRIDIMGKIPQHGDYLIKIYGKTKGVRGEMANICNYMICTEDPRPSTKRRKGWENAREKLLRKGVKEATAVKDIDLLKVTIDKFVNAGLEDRGDYTKASTRLEFLEVKQTLINAINRRNDPCLVRAISMARGSGYVHRLTTLVKQAEDLLAELRRLKGFQHPIPDLNKPIIAELMNYKSPLPMVHDVMIATFLLLGEKEEDLMIWEYIQNLMRKTGKKSLMNRFQKFNLADVPEEVKTKAQNIFMRFTEDDVRKTSAGAASFFVWIQKVMKEPDPPPVTEVAKNKKSKK